MKIECDKCGEVEDIPHPIDENLVENGWGKLNFDGKILVFCPECRKNDEPTKWIRKTLTAESL